MTVVIIILCAMLYLLLGAWLFMAAVGNLGGKGTYLEIISRRSTKPGITIITYYICMLLVVLFWPLFILSSLVGMIRRKK